MSEEGEIYGIPIRISQIVPEGEIWVMDGKTIARIIGVKMEGESPETTHDELLHDVRSEIDPAIVAIFDALHETSAVGVHEQWTIPLHASCGFSGEIVLRVESLGTCTPLDHEQFLDARIERAKRYVDLLLQRLGLKLTEEPDGC